MYTVCPRSFNPFPTVNYCKNGLRPLGYIVLNKSFKGLNLKGPSLYTFLVVLEFDPMYTVCQKSVDPFQTVNYCKNR